MKKYSTIRSFDIHYISLYRPDLQTHKEVFMDCCILTSSVIRQSESVGEKFLRNIDTSLIHVTLKKEYQLESINPLKSQLLRNYHALVHGTNY